MQKWEYKIIVRKSKKLLKKGGPLDAMSETLNSLGEEGWELVNIAPFSATQGLDLGGSTKAYTFVFKRPTPHHP